MSPNKQSLLVPIQVEALVIEDRVIDTAIPTVEDGSHGRVLAGDGKWSPKQANYAHTHKRHGSPNPAPFFNATREFGGKKASQLLIDENNDALPQTKDRGVYVRWLLPPRLRHAAESLQYPAIPDQWMLIRIARQLEQGESPQTQAWFLDSSLLTDEGTTILAETPSNKGKQRVVRGLGKVTPIRQGHAAKTNQGSRTVLTALGNNQTGSSTFSCSIGENRHCLSWHDDLEDLRQEGVLPNDLVLSYAVMGWYRDGTQDPLLNQSIQADTVASFSLRADRLPELNRSTPSGTLYQDFLKQGIMLPPQATIVPMKQNHSWRIFAKGHGQSFIVENIDNNLQVTSDLASGILAMLDLSLEKASMPAHWDQHRCVFHGMTTFINYWHAATYKGPMLGYPGAPPAHGTAEIGAPPFKIGMGHAPEDALIALAAEGQGQGKKGSAAWKALEAVVHNQSEQLMEGWDADAWFDRVHQNWFRPVEGGHLWGIRSEKQKRSPSDPTNQEQANLPRIDDDAREALRQLNQNQRTWDRLVRERQSWQARFQAHWQRLCRARNQAIFAEEAVLETLTEPIQNLINRLAKLRPVIDQHVSQLQTKLAKDRLILSLEPAPRYWMPTDPVILIQNAGTRTRNPLPSPLPCRNSTQIGTHGEIQLADGSSVRLEREKGTLTQINPFFEGTAAPVDALSFISQEALLLERLAYELAVNSLPVAGAFSHKEDWDQWRQKIAATFAQKELEDPHVKLSLFDSENQPLNTNPIARIWGKQPWSPLFLDWEVTWRPNIDPEQLGQDFQGWEFDGEDYRPKGKPPEKGHRFRGRSFTVPIDQQVVKRPLQTLRKLLREANPYSDTTADTSEKQVAKILSEYLVWWDDDLGKMEKGGLIGQSLSGLHQHFLGRDRHLPQIRPNPNLPWNDDPESPFTDPKAAPFLARHAEDPTPFLAPPAIQNSVPFTMVRGGSLTVEALWLIDDFGQWVDLLGGSSATFSSGTTINPHAAWPKDASAGHLAMPPRVVQPACLNFRFAGERQQDALNPIRGWVFYNYLDQALCVLDQKGRLIGELALVRTSRESHAVRWSEFGSETSAKNPFLQKFIQPLKQTQSLKDFLDLMDRAMLRIRPSSQPLEQGLMGRPLALVEAHLGLELFGHEWTNPADASTKGSNLDSWQIPVRLGHAQLEDGLVGFYYRDAFQTLIPAHGSQLEAKTSGSSGYLADPNSTTLAVSVGQSHDLVLLMDPRGTVNATTGILPQKRIRLQPDLVEDAFEAFELSFQTGPILVQGDSLNMPLPSGDRGRWMFQDLSGGEAESVQPLQTNRLDKFAKTSSIQGRLVLDRAPSSKQ